MPISRFALVSFAVLLLAGCGHVDDYPMHNNVTGEMVTCHSGLYWFTKDDAEQRVAEQCIASCQHHGFDLAPGATPDQTGLLGGSPDDIRSLTPVSCLP